MKLLLHGCYRNDAIMNVSQKRPRLLRGDRVCFHQNDACNDLQTIGNPVLNFFEQYVFLPQQIVLFVLQLAPNRNVLNSEQNGRVGTFLVKHLASVQAHDAGAKMRKFVLNFVIFHHAMFWDNFFQQQAKFWNIPLPVT